MNQPLPLSVQPRYQEGRRIQPAKGKATALRRLLQCPRYHDGWCPLRGISDKPDQGGQPRTQWRRVRTALRDVAAAGVPSTSVHVPAAAAAAVPAAAPGTSTDLTSVRQLLPTNVTMAAVPSDFAGFCCVSFHCMVTLLSDLSPSSRQYETKRKEKKRKEKKRN